MNKQDIIGLLAKAINTGKRWHVFQYNRYCNSFHNEIAALQFKQCGYKVIYLGK